MGYIHRMKRIRECMCQYLSDFMFPFSGFVSFDSALWEFVPPHGNLFILEHEEPETPDNDKQRMERSQLPVH